MFAIVFAALSFFVAAAFLVGVAAFLEVAFADPAAATARARASSQWRPPLIHGEELFAWAAGAARSTVRRRLPAQRGANIAKALAAEIAAGTDFAVKKTPHQVKRPAEHACSNGSRQMIAVTVPEVLGIVDAIRAERPADLPRVRERAKENVARIGAMDRRQYAIAEIDCPLHCDDDRCAANGSRPIQCRGWLPLLDPVSYGESLCDQARDIDPYAYTVSQGVEEGLSCELSLQGLDGACYELNGALAVAIDTPRAAKLWANGQPVFAACQRLDPKLSSDERFPLH